MKKLLVVLAGAFAFASCSKSTGTTVTGCNFYESTTVASAAETAYIQSYLTTNGWTATQHASGVFYEVTTPGSGITIGLCSTVTVKYTGKLFNGTIFDQNLFGTAFILGNLITGWQKAMPFVKKGGTIRMYIPPSLGYGSAGSGTTVPPNSYLLFDVQVMDAY